MTKSPHQSVSPPQSHSRYIRDPDAEPSIEIRTSHEAARAKNRPASVSVRCGPCNKRLYDVQEGQRFQGNDDRVFSDGALVVKRKCPKCRSMNEGRVTASVGRPLEESGALRGPWLCAHCDRSLGKIDPIRGQVVTTCQCGHPVRVVAATAIASAYYVGS
jgi:phage FluMu protein Com